MEFATGHLAALLAIADHGTFEAAGRALHVTPSAVSQRIRALESQVGQVVVERTTPCRPTAAGQALLRLARQASLLHDEAMAALSETGSLLALPVAVNADSLATWLRPVLGKVASWPDVALRLHVEDQAFSADLLRSGDVLAAVTADDAPVQGCSVQRLGVLRYAPAATPDFAERWRRGRAHDWGAMPVVVFNEKDLLQAEVLQGRGHAVPPVVHRVPTSEDFLQAVRAGLGWGALPEPQLRPALDSGDLVRLGRQQVDVPLYWQRWRLHSDVLDRLTAEVVAAARAGLRR